MSVWASLLASARAQSRAVSFETYATRVADVRGQRIRSFRFGRVTTWHIVSAPWNAEVAKRSRIGGVFVSGQGRASAGTPSKLKPLCTSPLEKASLPAPPLPQIISPPTSVSRRTHVIDTSVSMTSTVLFSFAKIFYFEKLSTVRTFSMVTIPLRAFIPLIRTMSKSAHCGAWEQKR